MPQLRDADRRRGFELVGRVVDAASSAEAFARAAVAELPRVVASELTTLSICDLAGGHRRVVADPPTVIGADECAAFDRHFGAHPLVRYHGYQHGRGAQRISDSVPFARFRETVLYADYYRRIGIDHVVALPLVVDQGLLVSLVLNRRRHDFDDRERELLDAIGAPLSRLWRGLQRAAAASLPASLTPRELEVLGWVAAGKTYRDVAAILGCSHRTVHKHLQRIYVKLGVETRTAAAMRLVGAGGAQPRPG